jgi:hypothetical protein
MRLCYILRRTKGNTLYLTPFVDPKLSNSWSEDEEIRWHASTGLHTHEKDDALFTLYTQIDRGVDRWIQDARYLPRLLISALVFLITYFFFSLAVRDPIPMIDELIISSALAVTTAVVLGRRDKKGEVAMKRRLVLKQQASRSDFAIEEGLSSYEEFLDTCSFIDTIDLAERLALTGSSELPTLSVPEEHKGDWEQDFKQVLFHHFELTDKALYARFKQAAEIQKGGSADEAFAARLVKLSMQGQIDLPLLSLMVALSK